MPHLDSDIIRPVYDVHEGGAPVAFRCMILVHDCDEAECLDIQCAKITRTLRGMRMHQKLVHHVRAQGEFNFEDIKPTTE